MCLAVTTDTKNNRQPGKPDWEQNHVAGSGVGAPCSFGFVAVADDHRSLLVCPTVFSLQGSFPYFWVTLRLALPAGISNATHVPG